MTLTLKWMPDKVRLPCLMFFSFLILLHFYEFNLHENLTQSEAELATASDLLIRNKVSEH